MLISVGWVPPYRCPSRRLLFVHSVRAIDRPGAVKVLRVTLAQAPRRRFTDAFVKAFRLTDWSRFPNGGDWPE
jgi:hypothetical protein